MSSIVDKLDSIRAERKSQHNLKTQAQLADIAACFEENPSSLFIRWSGTIDISPDLTKDALKTLDERGFIAKKDSKSYSLIWEISVDASKW